MIENNKHLAPTCKAWISKVTKLVGPPLEIGMFDNILARVKAVATSPSSSIRSEVPVGKKGRTSVKEATNSFGNAYITDSCSKITPGELNEAKKATCCPRIPCALDMNKLGKPSSNVLNYQNSINKPGRIVETTYTLTFKWQDVRTAIVVVM